MPAFTNGGDCSLNYLHNEITVMLLFTCRNSALFLCQLQPCVRCAAIRGTEDLSLSYTSCVTQRKTLYGDVQFAELQFSNNPLDFKLPTNFLHFLRTNFIVIEFEQIPKNIHDAHCATSKH